MEMHPSAVGCILMHLAWYTSERGEGDGAWKCTLQYSPSRAEATIRCANRSPTLANRPLRQRSPSNMGSRQPPAHDLA